MTDINMMCQMVQCLGAMKQGIEEDAAYALPGSRKRKDGTAFWLNAAYNFSRIMGVEEHTYSADDMRCLYAEALQ